MKHKGDSKKQIAYSVQLFDEKSAGEVSIPDEIHVLPTGTFKHPYYGEFTITSADISKIVRNFDVGIRSDLRITQGHDTGMGGVEAPAIAWFKTLRDAGVKGLYATIEWTEQGKELLKSKAFKYFSAELFRYYVDPQTGEEREMVLDGGALTNRPYFRQLDPVVSFSFSEGGVLHFSTDNQQSDMKIEELLAKDKAQLTSEEKAFIKANKDSLSDEQKASHKDVIEDAPAPAPTPAPAPEPTPAPAPAGESVSISASEYAILKEKADAGHKALEKLEASEREAAIKAMTFSSTNKDGKFAPAQTAALNTFMTTLNEAQRKQFKELVDGMPKMQSFKEIGGQGAELDKDRDVFAEVNKEVNAKMKENTSLGFSKALSAVFNEKPELREAYQKKMQGE